MKYRKRSLEECIEIGHKIYESDLTFREAAKVYGVSHETAHRYQLLYEENAGLDHFKYKNKSTSSNIEKSKESSKNDSVSRKRSSKKSIYLEYENMTKEELIQEIMKSKVTEARLKKGYRVKGAGAEKEFILLSNKNTK